MLYDHERQHYEDEFDIDGARGFIVNRFWSPLDFLSSGYVWPRISLFSATGGPRRERQDSAAQRACEDPWEQAGRRHPSAFDGAQEIDGELSENSQNAWKTYSKAWQTTDRQLTDN